MRPSKNRIASPWSVKKPATRKTCFVPGVASLPVASVSSTRSHIEAVPGPFVFSTSPTALEVAGLLSQGSGAAGVLALQPDRKNTALRLWLDCFGPTVVLDQARHSLRRDALVRTAQRPRRPNLVSARRRCTLDRSGCLSRIDACGSLRRGWRMPMPSPCQSESAPSRCRGISVGGSAREPAGFRRVAAD